MGSRVINGFLLVALLFAVPSVLGAQSVPTVETVGLTGAVRSFTTETVSYSYVNGDRESSSRSRGLEYEFDRRGLVVSEVGYDYNNFANRTRVFEFDASRRIVSINIFDGSKVLSGSEEYTYGPKGGHTRKAYRVGRPGQRVLESVTEYDESGTIVKETTYAPIWNSRDRRVASTTKVEKSPDGTTYSYSADNQYESVSLDARGALKSNYYLSGSSTATRKYSYGANGLLSKVEEYDSSTGEISFWEVSYTPLGQPEEIRHLDNLGRLVSKVNREYLSGRLSSESSVHYDANEKPIFTWVYHYDSDGNAIGKSLSFAGFPERFVWKTRYRDGKAVERTITNGRGRVLEGYRLSYDSRGLLTRRVEIGRNGVVRGTLDQVLRSENEVESYISANASGVTDKHYTNTYDEKGKLLREVTYNTDVSVLTIREYRYHYDHNGNWTRLDVYETNNPQEYYDRLTQTTTRTISYY